MIPPRLAALISASVASHAFIFSSSVNFFFSSVTVSLVVASSSGVAKRTLGRNEEVVIGDTEDTLTKAGFLEGVKAFDPWQRRQRTAKKRGMCRLINLVMVNRRRIVLVNSICKISVCESAMREMKVVSLSTSSSTKKSGYNAG